MKTKKLQLPNGHPAGGHPDRSAPALGVWQVRRRNDRRRDDHGAVKTSLLNDPDVGGLRIDVDTFKGVVTLSGAVKTPAERDKAVALARKVGGVTDVKSTLQIQP